MLKLEMPRWEEERASLVYLLEMRHGLHSGSSHPAQVAAWCPSPMSPMSPMSPRAVAHGEAGAAQRGVGTSPAAR